MKKLTVAISAVAASVLMAMSAQAAEIYNKDSNKLDLYGKLMLSTTSPLMMQMMVILLMPVLASKVKPKSTIN
ncbi:outer membrane porin protein, N-ter fragment [Escherichia coli]|nr:outer membrane porin protein, N-ter fragment [Escherichia coli]